MKTIKEYTYEELARENPAIGNTVSKFLEALLREDITEITLKKDGSLIITTET